MVNKLDIRIVVALDDGINNLIDIKIKLFGIWKKKSNNNIWVSISTCVASLPSLSVSLIEQNWIK